MNGFWITYTRLALLVLLVACIPTGAFIALSLSGKVSNHDLTSASRQSCERNVGTAHDLTRLIEAERTYKTAVIHALSVKSDVKRAASAALRSYDEVRPRFEGRIIDCGKAFPNDGKPRIVRVK